MYQKTFKICYLHVHVCEKKYAKKYLKKCYLHVNVCENQWSKKLLTITQIHNKSNDIKLFVVAGNIGRTKIATIFNLLMESTIL